MSEIAKDGKLMSELPLAVRRQVWTQKANPELFRDYVLSLMQQFALQPVVLGQVSGMRSGSINRKARAVNKPLQDLIAACGDNAALYRETVDILGQAYLQNSNNVSLCSLRQHLPLAALEAGVKHVSDTDACCKLAKCLADAARDLNDVSKQGQGVLKTLSDIHDLAKSLRPLHVAMLLRAPEASEYVTAALLAACRRVAESQSSPKDDALLKAGSKILVLSSHPSLHRLARFPASDGVKHLLEEVYPALLVCVVDDLLREGEGECEPLEPALHSLASSYGEVRRLVLQYMEEAVNADSQDTARFLSLLPLYTTASKEAAAAAADVTPDEEHQVPVNIDVSEETRRLAGIARRLLDGHHKGSAATAVPCLAAMLPTLTQALRDGCSIGAVVAALGVADVVAASKSPPDAGEMDGHVELICDVAERLDPALLAKAAGIGGTGHWLQVGPVCKRLADKAPVCAERLLKCFKVGGVGKPEDTGVHRVGSEVHEEPDFDGVKKRKRAEEDES